MVPSFPVMKTRRLTLRRVLAGFLVLAIVAYLGAIVWLVANETRLIFAAVTTLGDRRPSQPYEQIDSRNDDGARVRAWLLPAPSAGTAWVLFLHGNDSNIGSRLNILHCEQLRALGLNVLAPEYRGFGGLDGVPTENGLADDARRAYDYLRTAKQIEAKRIVIYGWSLGSAVAVNLASRVDEGAVVLEGAPASIVAIGQQRYPMFPIRLIIRNPFESILRVGAIRSPMLFLHSPEDVVIPIAEGRRLFEAAPGPKQFVEVAGGHVYASEKDPTFFPAIRTFLRAQHLLP
jgi:pimeloyl-ACP methyl ester carboxylesterase